MLRIRYAVAMSVDGYIAGPNGECDWIIMDPEIDFREMFEQFDTILIGRRTFELTTGSESGGGPNLFADMKTYVFSHTLKPSNASNVTLVGEDWKETLTALRNAPGKDIWLFGGGELFRSLHDAGLVDSVEVAVIPAILGDGNPLYPPPFKPAKLKLANHTVHKSGIIGLEYSLR